MKLLYKHGVKFFFGAIVLLFVVAFTFSAISFARYVSYAGHNNGAGAAAIDCAVNVDGGGSNTFVNAPYMQTVSGGNTQPVRMNNWADTVFSVENRSKHGLKYEYSFVFYIPDGFAEKMMFQLLELDRTDGNVGSSAAAKASKLFRISDDMSEIEEATHTKDGIPFENEYSSLIASGGLLDIEGGTVMIADSSFVPVKTTFATNWTETDLTSGVIAGQLASPVSFMLTKELGYKRVTVNIARDADGYVLDGGQKHTYILRTVLLESRESDDYNITWRVEDCIENGEYVEPIAAGDVAVRWNVDHTGLEAAVKNADGSIGTYRKVNVGNCMGLGSPCKIAAVFTQVA